MNMLDMKEVTARALPAPGYMGLKDAHHVYLTESQNHQTSWGCFGRSYMPSEPGSNLGTFKIYLHWATVFVAPNAEPQPQYQGGIYNTVNGTCHTIANRILALSDNNQANVSASVDDKYSVVVFGKYGAGTEPFVQLLRDSAAQASIPDTTLESIIARVKKPEEDELTAWAEIIQSLLNIDIKAWLDGNPAIKNAALIEMRSWCDERDTIYQNNIPYPQMPLPPSAVEKYRQALLRAAIQKITNILEHFQSLPSMEWVERQLQEKAKQVINGVKKQSEVMPPVGVRDAAIAEY